MTPEEEYALYFPGEAQPAAATPPALTPAPTPREPIQVGAPEIDEAEWAQYFPGGEPPSADAMPAPAEPAIPEPTPLQKAKHVMGGLAQGGIEATVDLPKNLSKITAPASEWVLKQMAKNIERPWYYGPDINSPLAFTIAMLNSSNQDPESGRLFGDLPSITDNEQVGAFVDKITKEQFPREAAPGWDSLRTGAEWGVAGIPNALRKISTRPDLWMAGGAMAGEAIADYAGADSEMGQMLALPALIASILKKPGNSASTPGAQKALNLIDDWSLTGKGKRGPTGWDTPVDDAWGWGIGAGEDFSKADAPLLAAAKEARARGEAGALADITNDFGLMQVDNTLRSQSPQAFKAGEVADTARQAQIARELAEPFTDANVAPAIETAGEIVKKRQRAVGKAVSSREEALKEANTIRVEEVDAGIEDAARAARETADLARQADEAKALAGRNINTGEFPEETSSAVFDVVEGDYIPKRAVEKSSWKTFETGDKVDMMPLKVALGEVMQGLDGKEKDQFIRKFGQLFADLETGTDMSPKAMQTMITDLNDVISNTVGGANPQIDARIRTLQAVRDAIVKAGDQANSGYKISRELNKLLRSQHGVGALPKAAKRPRSPDVGGAGEPELYIRDLGGAVGEEGAVAARRLVETGADVTPVMARHLKAKGVVAPNGIDEQFLVDHRGWLSKLPEDEYKQFTDYVAANRTAETATEAAENAKKTLLQRKEDAVQVDKPALEQSLKAGREKTRAQGRALRQTMETNIVEEFARSPTVTVQKALKPDNLKDLKALNDAMVKAGQGDSFRRSVGRELADRLAKGEINKADGVLAKNLIDSGVLSLDEVNDIKRATNKMKSFETRKTAAKMALTDDADEFDSLMASGLSILGLQAVPTGNASLVAANAMRRYIKHAIKGARKGTDDLEKLEEFLMNPDKYIRYAENAADVAAANRKILSSIVGTANAAKIRAEVDESGE